MVVDRQAVSAGGDADQLHDRIRAAASLPDRDELIAEILRHAVEGPQLFSSISAYNEFAVEYDCTVTPVAPYWERDFPLGNGGILRIRGMTSTLIFGPRDHADTHRVVYGSAQRACCATTTSSESSLDIIRHLGPLKETMLIDASQIVRQSNCMATSMTSGTGGRVVESGSSPVRCIRKDGNPVGSRGIRCWLVDLMNIGGCLIRVYPRRWSREETTFIGDFNSRGHDYRDHVIEQVD